MTLSVRSCGITWRCSSFWFISMHIHTCFSF